jgi:hypothetical protein
VMAPAWTNRVRVRKSGIPRGIISARTLIKVTASPGSSAVREYR